MTYTIEEQEIIKGFAKEMRKKTEALINCLKTDDRISNISASTDIACENWQNDYDDWDS